MLIGISGPRKSGKTQTAEILSKLYGFQLLKVSEDHDQFCFSSFTNLLHFATKNWKSNYCVIAIEQYQDYEVAFKRPFFVMLWVDAPISKRYARLLQTPLPCISSGINDMNLNNIPCSAMCLEEFLKQDESDRFNKNLSAADTNTLNDIQYLAHLKLLNDSNDLSMLESKIELLNVLDPCHLRPSWDQYFMGLCELASQRSNCMKRRVGCIITSDNRVISAGYNGTPKGIKNCNDGGCKRCNDNCARGSNLDTCICLHAEENALLEAGRARISDRKVTLYCNTCPVRMFN